MELTKFPITKPTITTITTTTTTTSPPVHHQSTTTIIVIEVSEGVPHSLRPVLWPRLLDIEAKKERLGLAYKDVISTMIFCTLTIND